MSKIVGALVLKEFGGRAAPIELPDRDEVGSLYYSTRNCWHSWQACQATLEKVLRYLDEGKPISSLREEIDSRLPYSSSPSSKSSPLSTQASNS